MNVESYSTDDRKFIAFAINHFGTGQHPMAQPDDTLAFFQQPYVRECVERAAQSGKLTVATCAVGQRLSESMR